MISFPKQIGKQAKAVFAGILNHLNGKDYFKLDNGGEGIMPLSVEITERNIDAPHGKGYLISLAHYYKQQGDMLRDPEIVFLVVDNRKEPGDLDMLGIWPAEYTQ